VRVAAGLSVNSSDDHGLGMLGKLKVALLSINRRLDRSRIARSARGD